jgi:hypothetical protein
LDLELKEKCFFCKKNNADYCDPYTKRGVMALWRKVEGIDTLVPCCKNCYVVEVRKPIE